MTSGPAAGDVIEIDDELSVGHEQRGRRPAVVVSSDGFQASGFAIVCPLTTHGGRGRFSGSEVEVPVPPGLSVSGVILSYHPKTIDWRARNATRVDRLPRATLLQVRSRLKAFLGL